MDQIEQMPLIRSNDIHVQEMFSDLVRISVVKLWAPKEKIESLEMELTLHSLLVNNFPYSSARELQPLFKRTCKRKISFCFQRLAERRGQIPSRTGGNGERGKSCRAPKYPDLGRMRNFHTALIGIGMSSSRSPCSLCQRHDRDAWFWKQFYNKGVDECWQKRKVKERALTIEGKIAEKLAYVE